jgi:hypothetical protein
MFRFTRLRALYRRHFRDHRRERMFLASLCFFCTFAIARLLTHGFHSHDDPFMITIGGVHVHHMVWGIFLLLIVGYLWLVQADVTPRGARLRIGRLTALLYGLGAALTLDEFALWLNLKDVYWSHEGRASIDAVFLFGGLVSVGLWGGPFVRAASRQVVRMARRFTRQAATPAIEPEPVAPADQPVEPA